MWALQYKTTAIMTKISWLMPGPSSRFAALGGLGHDSPLRSRLLWQLQKSELAQMQSIRELFPSQAVESTLFVQQSLKVTAN
jgi:hypothetical protein